MKKQIHLNGFAQNTVSPIAPGTFGDIQVIKDISTVTFRIGLKWLNY